MATKYRLQDATQLAGKDIFFDANILIYLFWPTGQHHYEKNYARIFNELLKQKNRLYVDFLVISEVINRVVRMEHKKLSSTQKFKDFRNSQDGKEALHDIYVIVKDNILNRFNIVGKALSKQEISSYLLVNELDFVDKAIVTICKENGLVLLTNDGDFKNTDLDILTSHPSILS